LRIGIDGRNLGSATDGIGRFVHNAVKALAALGVDVVVYAPGRINPDYDFSPGVCVRVANFKGPVATSNTSSMPEVAGDNAVLVDPNDPGAIAAAFSQLCADLELRNGLAAGAQRNAWRLTWDNHARGMLRILNRSSSKRKSNA